MKTTTYLILLAGFLSILLHPTVTEARSRGVCATGYVTTVTEGAFNAEHLNIILSYTSEPPPTTGGGYMRFRTELGKTRLQNIRALAYTALVTGAEVEVRTGIFNEQGLEDCAKANELKILSMPRP